MTNEPERSADPNLADISRLLCVFDDYGLPRTALAMLITDDSDMALDVMSETDRTEVREALRRVRARAAAEDIDLGQLEAETAQLVEYSVPALLGRHPGRPEGPRLLPLLH